MAAALGLELTMRVANMTARYNRVAAQGGTPKNLAAKLEKVKNCAMDGTFGQVTKQFREMFPELVTPLFVESTGNAIYSRNHLSHHFLGGHLTHLWTEQGLNIIVAECIAYKDHFESLENHIREYSGVDFQLFARSCAETAEAHPDHPWTQLLEGVSPEEIAPTVRRHVEDFERARTGNE